MFSIKSYVLELVLLYHHPARSLLAGPNYQWESISIDLDKNLYLQVVNDWELAKSEMYWHLFIKDGLIHFVSQIWNNLIYFLMFQIFERIVRAKLDISGIGGRVGLNLVKQTLDILGQFCLQLLWKQKFLRSCYGDLAL